RLRDRRFLMRYMDLVKSVQRQVRKRLSYRIVDTILRACFAVIARTLEQGEPVYIPEFGRFEMTTARSRMVVSNLEGEARYEVPERRRVRFVPSAAWVRRLNGERGSTGDGG
ncbi:MAG: HU family DNA-binding protein, partial [Anaerolineae bacterium]|nr:HU family DNA-binding protein [Anaerolineae bacterium]